MPKFSSAQKLREAIAAGVAKNQPVIDAVVDKAVAAAIRANGSTAKAIAKLNDPRPRTSTAKADAQAAAQARLMLTGPRMPVPTREMIESVTQKNATGAEVVVGAMRVARLQRAGKM